MFGKEDKKKRVEKEKDITKGLYLPIREREREREREGGGEG